MTIRVCSALLAIALAPISRADDLFSKEIAPIFERRCVSCHHGSNPKGGLSLADSVGLSRGGESGPVVVTGKPDESLLLDQVTGDKPAMPQEGPPLKPEEINSLRAWIKKGANYPQNISLRDRKFEGQKWWSLEKITKPSVPSTTARTPIDAFLIRELKKQGLSLSPPADKRTLIRRLSFDLLGLPPTPEQVEAFVSSNDPKGYEKLVDEYLASPHYGERWARHWLDVVHFGETHGFDKDKIRPNAWPYRDFVINAFNNDKPFGQFIEEQLAGDVIRPDDPEGNIATGFVVAGPWDFVGQVELAEGTVNKDITRTLDRDDMVANVMSTFCSLTVHCARCHDHPFDPIPQADYYGLQAVFSGVERTDVDIEPRSQREQRRLWTAKSSALQALLTPLQNRQAARRNPAVLGLDRELEKHKRQLAQFEDKGEKESPSNGFHSGIATAADTTYWVQVDLGQSVPIDEIRLVPARPTDFPDTKGFGFPLRYRVTLSQDAIGNQSTTIADETKSDVPNPGDNAVTIPAPGQSARYVKIIATKLWRRGGNDFVFALSELQIESKGKNVALGAAVTAQTSIDAGRWSTRYLVDGFDSRHSLSDRRWSPEEKRQRQFLREEIARLEIAKKSAIEAAVTPLAKQEEKRLERELETVTQQLKGLPTPKKVYAVRSIEPRPIHRLHRGETTAPRELVSPGSVGCCVGMPKYLPLSPASTEGERRLALAKWISDPNNPLTWRSIVNRVWHYHMGRGIVETPNDFGRQGALPTHPELLDWLASDFLENGQSLKRLHRQIVLSSAYQQSSADNTENAKIDSGNRFLWRMNRRRLDAESIRDAVLKTSGQLDRSVGGPSFFAFAFEDDHSPRYLYEKFNVDEPASKRRSIYRFVVRSAPDPFMECLDCADPSQAVPARDETVTPQQALALLNNPFMIRQAELLAERAKSQQPSLEGQLSTVFRWTLLRTPGVREKERLLQYASIHGLANACRLLLNCNEFVFVD